MKAIFPGSFDPITNGHLDIIRRSSVLFDELVVAIMVNPEKKSTFSVAERVAMIEEAVVGIPHISVQASTGLTVDYARAIGANVLVRGIRAVMDYEYELNQATANMMLDHEIESMFLVSMPQYSFLSSSTVKTISANHGSVRDFVPPCVELKLKERYEQIDSGE